MISFNGAMTYKDLVNMPIPELFEWAKRSAKINDDFKREQDKIMREAKQRNR